MNFLWLIHADSAICFGLDTVSLNSQRMALQKYMKRLKSQKEQWVLFDDNHVQKSTATRGHNIPPILPPELAILMPIVRTEDGYIYISVK